MWRWRNHSGEAAEFRMNYIVDGLAWGIADGEGNLARRLDGDVNQPGLVGGGDEGEFGFRGGGKDVHEEIGRQAIRDVGRQIKMIVPDFSVFAPRGNLSGPGVNQDVHRLRKGGAVLHVMVTDETEDALE